MAHLGLAYPLYFVFIKLCALMVAVHFLSVGIAQMALNLVGSQCKRLNIDTRICRLSFINSLDFSDLQITYIQNGLNISFILLAIVMVEWIKYRSNQFRLDVSRHERTPADYSILVRGLPKDITIYEIQHFMDEELSSLKVDPSVVKIYLIYDVKEYLALYTKKREVYEHKCQLADNYNTTSQKALSIDDPIKRKQMLKKAEDIFEEIS